MNPKVKSALGIVGSALPAVAINVATNPEIENLISDSWGPRLTEARSTGLGRALGISQVPVNVVGMGAMAGDVANYFGKLPEEYKRPVALAGAGATTLGSALGLAELGNEVYHLNREGNLSGMDPTGIGTAMLGVRGAANTLGLGYGAYNLYQNLRPKETDSEEPQTWRERLFNKQASLGISRGPALDMAKLASSLTPVQRQRFFNLDK